MRIRELLPALMMAMPVVGVSTAVAQEQELTIGGVFRYQYVYRDWVESSKDKGGDITFDVFRLNVDGNADKVQYSAEYRWYQSMNLLHHAWIGYDHTDELTTKLGIQPEPFGLLPYASNNFLESANYLIGLEDTYDSGLGTYYEGDRLSWSLAFFKNPALGNPADLERYSVDVVNDSGCADATSAECNEQTNQLNARTTYSFDHGGESSTTVGVSARYGQLYNSITEDTGDHHAGAVHLEGDYGRWNLQLQASKYRFDPDAPSGSSTINVGAFGGSWDIPSEATTYVANLAYELPVSLGPVTSLTFYNDYSTIVDKSGEFPDSQQNVLGMLITAGDIYTYVDFAQGKNVIGFGDGSIAGNTDDQWHSRFNISVGYYF